MAGAALAYGIAIGLGGSGFIAAFVAGMTFRLVLGRDPGELNDLAEQVGNVLNAVTFVLFGAILLGPALGELSWELALYAVLSLTVVRMIPVAIAMVGTRARLPTVGFLGWFGPRGLASIVFAVIVVEESNLAHESLIGACDLSHGRAVGVHPRPNRSTSGPASTRAGTNNTLGRRRLRWRASRWKSRGYPEHWPSRCRAVVTALGG